MDAKSAHKTLVDAIKLDRLIAGKSKNATMERIMSHYPEFFDEESGNTKEQGLKDLHTELTEELDGKLHRYKEAKKKVDEFNKQSYLLVIFPFHFISVIRFILPIITLVISILSLILTLGPFFLDIFQDLYIYLPDFLLDLRDYILSITKYEIIFCLTSFI